MHFSIFICILRFKKFFSSSAIGFFSVTFHNSTTNGNTVTFQIYLKVMTSHYFNCHPKAVKWLLSEMLITAWSLVFFCLDSSFDLNSSGEGITGNFNRKTLHCKYSLCHPSCALTSGMGLLLERGSLLLLKVFVSLYCTSTNSIVIGSSSDSSAMCCRTSIGPSVL